ncbi:hypothetical protein CBR_g11129 [Chara braunii]|uniref:Uncharacterized protein n=1 Tax=Chara braunii TaxID=69332 RepID=A0A388KQ91_CHABU|nr:hypothetical protein CBR_g11129 [Chara braunii]|eukprot:GBG72197.1 hypothetical protein CBR_g11129 [Chara braunii]
MDRNAHLGSADGHNISSDKATAQHAASTRVDPGVLPPVPRAKVLEAMAGGEAYIEKWYAEGLLLSALLNESKDDVRKLEHESGYWQGKLSMAAKAPSGHWLPLGFMKKGLVSHWQFMVMLVRVSLCNPDILNKKVLHDHAQQIWRSIDEDDRQMIVCGYDSTAKRGMWLVGAGDDGENDSDKDVTFRFLDDLHERFHSLALLGWVPVIWKEEHMDNSPVHVTFKDPLGVLFDLVYEGGLLRHCMLSGGEARDHAVSAEQEDAEQEVGGGSEYEDDTPGVPERERERDDDPLMSEQSPLEAIRQLKKKEHARNGNVSEKAAEVNHAGEQRAKRKKSAELPVIIADGIEYFLVDQIMDLTRRSKCDRNVIHCILHSVITDVLAGGETVTYSLAPPSVSNAMSTLVQDCVIECATQAICAAPTEVDRQRKRQQGWDLVAAECKKSYVEEEEDSSDQKVTKHDVKAEDLILQWTLQNSSHSAGQEENPTSNKAVERKFERSFVHDGDNRKNPVIMSQHFRTFDSRGQGEGEEAFDAQVDTESFDIFNEKLVADAYIDEDFCKILESKDSSEAGWCHVVLRLARQYSEPHPALRIVDGSASPDGKLMQLAVSSLMRTCQTGNDFSCGGKSWFVLVNKKVVMCTYEGWGDNLGCVIAGAVARADGHDVHPGLSNATAIMSTISRNLGPGAG